MLSMAEVARRMSVSKRTVLRWIESSILPAVRIGDVIRVDPQDLDQMLTHHRVAPRAESGGEAVEDAGE